jgi:hypothetical protein
MVADYNRLLQVQIKYFRNGYTSGNRHLCSFKWKGPILMSNLDSKLNSEFRASLCQHLGICHHTDTVKKL